MNLELALQICERHYQRWVTYKRSQSFGSGQHEKLAELNMVYLYLFKSSQNLNCRSCRAKLLANVYQWYETYLLNNTQPNIDLLRLTRKELIELAKDIPLPRNADKQTIIRLINESTKANKG